MTKLTSDIDDIFEEEAARLRAEADARDADQGLQARLKAKREAEVERGKRAGVLDADGHLILSDVEADDAEDDDVEDEDEDA